MINQLLTRDPLLGQLPAEVGEQVQDILARILKLAGYNANSNTDSNSVGGIRIPASDLIQDIKQGLHELSDIEHMPGHCDLG